MLVFANILAIIAELIGLFANANQLFHVARKKSILGVSGWTWTLSTGGNVAWVVYGAQKRIYALTLANVFLVCIGLAMITKLYRTRKLRKKMTTYAILTGIGLSVIFIGFPEFAGWLALVYGTMARVPQLYRAHNDDKLTGLSYKSQIAFYIENTLTGIYALLLGAWPLVVAAGLGFFTAGYMVIKVAKKGKTT